jgi:ribonucleotide reductase alpha subunit
MTIPCFYIYENIDDSIVEECKKLRDGCLIDKDIVQVLKGQICYDGDYSLLAGRILTYNLHRVLEYKNFEQWVENNHMLDPILKKSIIDNINGKGLHDWSKIDSIIRWKNDMSYDLFAIKSFMKSYATKSLINPRYIIDTPQLMLLRVSIGILGTDVSLDTICEMYNQLSDKKFTVATPTLFNAGHIKAQLASCFLVPMKADSMEGISDTWKNCALLSKNAGGLGVSVSNIRSKHSLIKGTGGNSNGLIPMLSTIGKVLEYADQGGGKRKGSGAIYIETHHPEFLDVLRMRKGMGSESDRVRTLFTAAWISDLFMERVEKNEVWTFMDPNIFPNLHLVWGDKYKELYEEYESEYKEDNSGNCITKGMSRVKARAVFREMIQIAIETGTPYILFKDTANRLSNQNHIGTIQSSNLCAGN